MIKFAIFLSWHHYFNYLSCTIKKVHYVLRLFTTAARKFFSGTSSFRCFCHSSKLCLMHILVLSACCQVSIIPVYLSFCLPDVRLFVCSSIQCKPEGIRVAFRAVVRRSGRRRRRMQRNRALRIDHGWRPRRGKTTRKITKRTTNWDRKGMECEIFRRNRLSRKFKCYGCFYSMFTLIQCNWKESWFWYQ